IRLQMAVLASARPLAMAMRAPDPAGLLAVRESVYAVVSELAAAQPPAPVAAPVAELAALAPQAIPEAPPARPEALVADDSGSATPDAPQTDIALALAAGFRLADPDMSGRPDTTDAAPEPEAQPSADTPLLAESSPLPQPRPDALGDALGDSLPDTAPATQIAEAAPPEALQLALADAAMPDIETGLEDTSPEDGMIWIGAEASFFDDGPDASEDMMLAHADLDIGAALVPDGVQSGIILTSTARDAGAQAIASVVEAQIASQPQGAGPEIVTRLSTSDGGRLWGVSLGQFNSRAAAERSLITVKMAEANSLGNGVSRIRQTSGRFEAGFAGLTQTEAERACLRLQARSMDCAVAYP
ncbi:MAG: hypothetical protein LAT78_13305, partial [Roseinatronobacter sp.]|nr:hypothetical protein [Roseinatronobacter sp.]